MQTHGIRFCGLWEHRTEGFGMKLDKVEFQWKISDPRGNCLTVASQELIDVKMTSIENFASFCLILTIFCRI